MHRDKGHAGISFDRFAAIATKASGSASAFGLACCAVVVWALCGPLFGFSETWQLVVNTGTTIITFLMVFVIQHGQNKDSAALHLKLDELLGAVKGANSKLVAVEQLDEEHLRRLSERYHALADHFAKAAAKHD